MTDDRGQDERRPAERVAVIARGAGHVGVLVRALEALIPTSAGVVLLHIHRAGGEGEPTDLPWLRGMVDDLAAAGFEATLHVAVAQSIAGGLREALDEIAPDLLVMDAAGYADARSGPYFRTMLAPPCLSVIVHGDVTGPAFERVLVASAAGVEVGSGLARAVAMLTAGIEPVSGLLLLRVARGAEEEHDLEAYRARIEGVLRDAGFAGTVGVAGADSPSLERGILRGIAATGVTLAMAETPVRGVMRSIGVRSMPFNLLRHSTVPLLLLTRPPSAPSRWVLSLATALYSLLPNMAEQQKVDVYADVRRAARGSQDFFVMLALSVALAACGLLLGSTAVVIGAMLVAPLMIPVVAIGLSIVQGDHRLLRLAARSVSRGIGIALAIGVVAGLAAGQHEPTSEYLARTEPTGLDILVAVVSGAAATYAISRRQVLAALPGAAVAVALVPPLATTGIAAAHGEWDDAVGAALLFVLNLNAVAATSVVIFLWLGFRPVLDRFGTVGLLGRGATLLVSLLVLVTALVLVPGR